MKREQMNCDNCKHYRWYYDRCEKWNCEVGNREVHNCFESMETPILDAMVAFPYHYDEDVKKENENASENL